MIVPSAINTQFLIITKTFLEGIPNELEEAAVVDGASDIKILTRVFLPLSPTVLATTGLFYAVSIWNQYLIPQIYLKDDAIKTIQQVLKSVVITDGSSGTTFKNVVLDGVTLNQQNLKAAAIFIAMLPIKAQGFGKVIVLVNSSNAMELGFLEDDAIDAALWIGSLGSTGFNAVGEILSGKVNPSGRLSDTYAYDLTSSPAYWNAGDFTYSNLDHHYVEYAEGIYVGYRFYETRYVDNTTGICDEAAYAKAVQYPFGYDLSYTTFEQSIADYKTTDSAIEMTVEVKNTGAVAGKDVVQVYYTAPYTVGGIEKSHVVLAGFAKTGLLQPGDSEKVTVSFAPEDMASYDETGAKAYVLEAGTYQIKLMNNAHDVIDQREYEVPATTTYSGDNARSTDLMAATNEFGDVAQGQIQQYVSRADWEGTLPTARTDGKTASAETVAAKENTPVYENNDSDQPITVADHGLTLEDMTGLDYDDPKWNDLLEQLSVDDMTNMIANGGWSTPEITSVGKPATNDLDGPAGINSLVSSLKGVSFPSEVIVSSSWNTDLAQHFGTAFGAEAAANHVVGLYAPGMNIHRTPFSGRNFEYYSEDGLLSGKMGAAMVQGVDSQGVYTYIKHFALNDQESNRLSISVWANEQSIREIYLKPFELSVKEGGTTAVMSSYSRLGNTWAGAFKALLTDVLRNEWGFHGMVVTDSAMGNTNWMDVNLVIRAGGDMMLCLMGVKVDSSTNTAQQTMRRACHNILYTQANSIAIAAAVDNTPYWLILLAIVDSILLIAIVLLLLKRIPTIKSRARAQRSASAWASLPWWHWYSGPCSSAAAAHRLRRLPLRAQPLPKLLKAPQPRQKKPRTACLWSCPRPTRAAGWAATSA